MQEMVNAIHQTGKQGLCVYGQYAHADEKCIDDGPEGKVYATSWSEVAAGTYQGEILEVLM